MSRAARAARALLVATWLAACGAQDGAIADPQYEPAARSGADVSVCAEPRPQACTREYRPVCADRDTGVRCVTTPCPSMERVTYPNACSACADPKVVTHTPGPCEPSDR